MRSFTLASLVTILAGLVRAADHDDVQLGAIFEGLIAAENKPQLAFAIYSRENTDGTRMDPNVNQTTWKDTSCAFPHVPRGEESPAPYASVTTRRDESKDKEGQVDTVYCIYTFDEKDCTKATNKYPVDPKDLKAGGEQQEINLNPKAWALHISKGACLEEIPAEMEPKKAEINWQPEVTVDTTFYSTAADGPKVATATSYASRTQAATTVDPDTTDVAFGAPTASKSSTSALSA